MRVVAVILVFGVVGWEVGKVWGKEIFGVKLGVYCSYRREIGLLSKS